MMLYVAVPVTMSPDTFVRPEHLAAAVKAIRRALNDITRDEFLNVLDQLGWFDYFYYSEEGAPQLHGLTDLQMVCLAGALRAYLEARF
jgi:hypothetical protein